MTMNKLITLIWQSVAFLAVMTMLTGVLYPGLIAGLGLVIGPSKDDIAMSIGPVVESPTYFIGRPSAVNGQPLPSGGSNLGPINAKLKTRIAELRDSLSKRFNVRPSDVPDDLVTMSASGIDPHISPQSARIQVGSVVKARGWPESRRGDVVDLIDRMTESPQYFMLGEYRVNVRKLNVALDQLPQQ